MSIFASRLRPKSASKFRYHHIYDACPGSARENLWASRGPPVPVAGMGLDARRGGHIHKPVVAQAPTTTPAPSKSSSTATTRSQQPPVFIVHARCTSVNADVARICAEDTGKRQKSGRSKINDKTGSTRWTKGEE